jgi:hypothetical protein
MFAITLVVEQLIEVVRTFEPHLDESHYIYGYRDFPSSKGDIFVEYTARRLVST